MVPWRPFLESLTSNLWCEENGSNNEEKKWNEWESDQGTPRCPSITLANNIHRSHFRYLDNSLSVKFNEPNNPSYERNQTHIMPRVWCCCCLININAVESVLMTARHAFAVKRTWAFLELVAETRETCGLVPLYIVSPRVHKDPHSTFYFYVEHYFIQTNTFIYISTCKCLNICVWIKKSCVENNFRSLMNNCLTKFRIFEFIFYCDPKKIKETKQAKQFFSRSSRIHWLVSFRRDFWDTL